MFQPFCKIIHPAQYLVQHFRPPYLHSTDTSLADQTGQISATVSAAEGAAPNGLKAHIWGQRCPPREGSQDGHPPGFIRKGDPHGLVQAAGPVHSHTKVCHHPILFCSKWSAMHQRRFLESLKGQRLGVGTTWPRPITSGLANSHASRCRGQQGKERERGQGSFKQTATTKDEKAGSCE